MGRRQESIECSFEGCENHGHSRGLCKGHYSQHRRGIPLKTLSKTRGGKNRMTGEKVCSFEGCGRPMWSKGLCPGHMFQQREGKVLRPIGSKRSKTTGFSETMTCHYCNKEKNWKAFVIGADRPVDQCRDCYRKALLPKDETTEDPTPASLEDVLKFIDKQCNKNAKRVYNGSVSIS